MASLHRWRLKVLAWDHVIFWNELLCNNTLPVGVRAHRLSLTDRSVHPEGQGISPASAYEVCSREREVPGYPVYHVQAIIYLDRSSFSYTIREGGNDRYSLDLRASSPSERESIVRLGVLKTEFHDHGQGARPGRCHCKLMQGSYEADGNRINVPQGTWSNSYVAGQC
ncbi:hypothetical protein FGSG_13599 [Fusarium graminearum PH-1]|uniref:Chromosome 4, complete genome n=1 Tax=Gibberella zeae (strain ATCC MYA-4620 / CBS 123657 / FGSC 9075 / NRRL 31084 / PH-1) TaxID=229533 RepID=I1S9R8_GIBZE|nr:hypothetical protein FGSG_13599 [Fusarium graminearum PH-1]ESU16091.1 hypothetical protein FGSG_13599 [Fusarium graminearum PH-1]CEF83278.1 unnamed protein product [Fusarium graminearum]|eukprot:XP_011328225.1 hypothetical protein FGSG_13599 [Fusarium graminearum PH-1]